MDKLAIKSFAISARKKLIQGVNQKAYQIGISEKEIKQVNEIQDGVSIEINSNYIYLTHSENEQREKLITQIESKGYEQVMEEVAYTWFNRIVAIRFMEVNEYLPTSIRVLSSEDKSKIDPDAVTQVNSIVEDLGLNLDTVYKFQDDNNDDGLFKYILIKQCNALGKIMPVMFEKIQDYTELLLPDNLLVEGNVVSDLVKNISEEDFKEQVEIIGWLYQYYISEKKDAVFADLKKNKKITKENIPAATQLFTPDWIVKYMVENSLGRLWLEGHPNEELQSNWRYYLEEAKQEAEVEAELKRIREESKSLSPEDITVLDPSMGSGHILVYAFDVLYQIYASAGYSEREIPRHILENNIYGLDIDDRAGQLAYFALIMKARSYSRRIFRDMERNSIKLNVCSIQESNGITTEDIQYFSNGDNKIKNDLEYLVKVFIDAKEYGSILEVQSIDFGVLENRLSEIYNEITDLFNKESRSRILEILPAIIKQGSVMGRKYDVMCTNPPYMGQKGIGLKLKLYLENNFKISKTDLFSVFMEIDKFYVKNNGYMSIINQHSWMFLSSFEKLRLDILSKRTINNMIHLGARAFDEIGGEVVQSTAFVLRKCTLNAYIGKYFRLVDFNTSELKRQEFIKRIDTDDMYICKQNSLNDIPGNTIAYWASKNILDIFKMNNSLKNVAPSKQGLATGDNDRFLRLWYETDFNNIGFRYSSVEETSDGVYKWFPCNKGGESRKWYGNKIFVVNWENNGQEIRNFRDNNGKLRSRPQNVDFYFRKGITWSTLSSRYLSMRYSEEGNMFETKGSMLFPIDTKNIMYILGYMNSKVVNHLIQMISPTMDFHEGPIGKIPIKIDSNNNYVDSISESCLSISKKDWDSFETSWNFSKHPIIQFKSNRIENSFRLWADFTEKQFNKLKSNEEELNHIFINMHKLQEELTPEVEEKDITIRKADRERDIKSFISYSVGCMLGRYSLDNEGLSFAGGKFDIDKYKTFKVDEDGIIPINDAQYFEDDIVAKFVEFVKVVFGEDTLEENLNYITDTESFKRKANETSRDCLRRYFLKGFIEDHLKIYQKRPIYWMFDSGKQNGFKALVYMHRYDESMIAKVRTDYLHSIQRTYEAEISRLENDITSEALSTKEKANAKKRKDTISKQLVECIAYDQVIAHVANQRVSIDLDDGVKVNYQKFQGVEVPMGDGKKDLKADLLFKIKM